MTSDQLNANVRRDRAVGAVLASAAADALGAPHEFGPALDPSTVLAMTGGGPFPWAPGEWTDDTQTALAILVPLSQGVGVLDLPDAVARGLQAWFASQPPDVGIQTTSVLSAAASSSASLAEVTAAWQASRPHSSGNGSLMRTGPLALAGRSLSRPALADLARTVSALTHASADAVEACILWTDAIRRAIDAPVVASGELDWVAHVAVGLDLLDESRRAVWAERLTDAGSKEPEEFNPNGYVVFALQAALSSLTHTEVPVDRPCRHLRLAIERVIRIGDDTDTVAAICGSLAGAWWGATAVPLEWRRVLNGRITYGTKALTGADLDRLARLAHDGGKDDPSGWPSLESMLPEYRRKFSADPLAEPLDGSVTVGNVYAVADQATRVDVVVSLCRMGRNDVPDGVEHQAIGLIDRLADDNLNVAFVLADTADYMADQVAAGRSVFLHCVQAENRTPAVAAAYLMRTQGLGVDDALAQVFELTGTRPKPFLVDGLRALEG